MVDKASGKRINKAYAEYKQREVNGKGEKLEKLYLSKSLKSKMLKQLRQHIHNDPIIKDKMANLGCILLYTFGNFLAPIYAAVHKVNSFDLGNEKRGSD